MPTGRATSWTRRRALLGWTVVCAVGWIVLGGIAESQEAQRRSEHGLFCFDSGVASVFVVIVVAPIWLVGALLVVSLFIDPNERRNSD